MSNKRSGFTSIECIISLSIICIAVSIISTSLYNSYNLANTNIVHREMLHKAKSTLEDMKYDIINNKLENIKDYYNVEEYRGYKIHTSLRSNQNYYQCYKLSVKITDGTKTMELNSYVTQQ